MRSQENSKSQKILCLIQVFSIMITIGNIVYSFANKRTPFDYASFAVITKDPYTVFKYSHFQFQIYMVCLIAQIITILASVLALLITMSLTRIYFFSCSLSNISKQSIILYLTIVTSIIGQTIVSSYFIQMKIDLNPESQINGCQQLVIGILSGINQILLVSVLTGTFYFQFYKTESDKPSRQTKEIDSMQIPKDISVLPLRTILNNRLSPPQINPLSDYRNNDKNPSSRRYIKSTISPNDVVLNQQHILNPHFLLPNPTVIKQSKQPLLQVQDQFSFQSEQSYRKKSFTNKDQIEKQDSKMMQNQPITNINPAIDLSNLSISIIKPKVRQKSNINLQNSGLYLENSIEKSKTNVIMLNPIQTDKIPNASTKNLRLNLKDIKSKLKKESQQNPFHVRSNNEETIYKRTEIDNVFFTQQ